MRALYLLLMLVGLTSCSTDGASTQPIASTASAVEAITHTPSATTVDSPTQTVREYLRWYSAHAEKLPTNFIRTVNAGHYAVDFQATENWLAAVRHSNLLSDTFLQHWRSYFRQYADTLRLHRQDDGPANGFEYNFLMLSQEPDARAAELRAGTFTIKMADTTHAVVVALGPQHEGWREGLTFTMSRANTGKWLIDEIKVPADLTR